MLGIIYVNIKKYYKILIEKIPFPLIYFLLPQTRNFIPNVI